jgi:hypothetical protein
MGLLDFVKDAGEKLFGIGKAKAAMQEVAAAPADEAKIKAANDAAADAIMDYIHAQNLDATGLTVTFDGAASTVSSSASRRTRRPRRRLRFAAATSPASPRSTT